MKKFFLQSLFIISLMFISVLFGMEQASDGIKRMRGMDDDRIESAIEFVENENGDMEVSLLGEKIDSHQLEIKKEKLEEIQSFNLFSSIGKKFAEGVTEFSKQLIEKLYSQF